MTALNQRIGISVKHANTAAKTPSVYTSTKAWKEKVDVNTAQFRLKIVQ